MGILQMLKKGKTGNNGLLLDWILLFQKQMEKNSRSNLELIYVIKIGSNTHTILDKWLNFVK